jgi:hypothetical protein
MIIHSPVKMRYGIEEVGLFRKSHCITEFYTSMVPNARGVA